jgi:protein tyrosine phosphatase
MEISAGVGRTGTYLAIDPLMKKVSKRQKVDILDRIYQMRKYRPQMVQNSVR